MRCSVFSDISPVRYNNSSILPSVFFGAGTRNRFFGDDDLCRVPLLRLAEAGALQGLLAGPATWETPGDEKRVGLCSGWQCTLPGSTGVLLTS